MAEVDRRVAALKTQFSESAAPRRTATFQRDDVRTRMIAVIPMCCP